MADSKASFLWAIKQQESGGDYRSVNSSSGALGAYQVMPSNVASWTQQALGKSLTPQQFLADNTAQDRVAETILGGYYDTYGARGAAAMWYSGQPDPNKTYGTPSVADYVKEVVDRMSSSSPVAGSNPVTGGVTQVGVADSLASGLSTGMTSAFKAVLAPMFLWVGYFATAFVGMGLIVIGAFLIVRESDTFKGVKSTITGAEPKEKTKEKIKPLISDEEKPETPKKTVTRKSSTKTRRKRVDKKSEQVAHQTPEQATAPKSFGPAHPSYRSTAAQAAKKTARKRVQVSGKVKGGPAVTVATTVGKRVVRARVQAKRRKAARRRG